MDDELWLEFVSMPHGLCGLCGNSGVVDTRNRMFSPAGYHAGVLAYCICPNGRAWKAQAGDLEALASSVRHAPRWPQR